MGFHAGPFAVVTEDFTKCSLCGAELVLIFFNTVDEDDEEIVDAALVCDACDMIPHDEPIDMLDEIEL